MTPFTSKVAVSTLHNHTGLERGRTLDIYNSHGDRIKTNVYHISTLFDCIFLRCMEPSTYLDAPEIGVTGKVASPYLLLVRLVS